MIDKKPANTREALLAELIGDVQVLLDRTDAMRGALQEADSTAKATATAIQAATSDYKTTINETVSRLRLETASIINQTTEHAARSLVGQQTSTLKIAAVEAIQQALTAELSKRSKRDWLQCVLISCTVGATIASLFFLLFVSLGRI